MGLVHIELFATLDFVGQAPGGPDEDPVGFPFGGWQAPLLDEVAGAQIGSAYEGTDALLLGRRTYDIFAAYWPDLDGEDNEIATLFNKLSGSVSARGWRCHDVQVDHFKPEADDPLQEPGECSLIG